ncbi:hypothetical protein ACHSBP_21315 [Pseudoalteromonas sp. XMcav1-K]|uniref:hypothetical protein n=1 Tax=Pseudoalteromonas sp. XMcav1-K TaxID=3374372 RepID=UPI0037581222
MNKQDFLTELADVMQLEDVIDETAQLSDYVEWDSMAYLGVISMFDIEFSKSITVEELKQMESVADLIELAGLSA